MTVRKKKSDKKSQGTSKKNKKVQDTRDKRERTEAEIRLNIDAGNT